ncbi:MAG TPA: PKD domain-containing protein, partial [Candidatus Didemnitutus sp.]|nr:PKD domain-containing protein [Candidatus Didemnitutus sp.]
MLRITTFMVLVLFSMSAAMAQTEYATWVFGTNAGLTFNNGSGGILDTPRVILNLPIDTREGSSSYSHPCVGSLTLYAMGETAYDGAGRVLDNGTILSGGSSSSQGALWVRDVSRPLSVYLFIPPDMTDVSATGTQHYTLNRAELGADGRWKMLERDVVLDPRPGSERIAATHDAAGTGYWVVTQFTDSVARNIEFVAYHVGMSGIDPAKVVSRFISSTVPHQAGIMKFSINGKRLAMTSVDDVVIGLYDFDPSSGVVSQQRQITLAALPEWQRASFCYGLTFTTSGNFLYTSVRALGTDGITRSSIVRLSVPLLNFDQNVVPEQIYATTLTNPYPAALQLGPNGKIYFTFNDNVGDMAYTDDFGVAVNSMAHRFPGISQPRLGLPTCIESTFPLPTPVLMCDLPSGTISVSDICEGGCTDITQNIQGSPKQWLWSFPGGRPSISTDSIPPRICYDTAGTYPVTLIVRNDAGAVQITDTVTIHAAPDVDAGPDTAVCIGSQLTLTATGAVTYRWSPASLVNDSTSATPRTVPLTQRTVFVVEGTGSDGCVGVDSVVVTPGVLQGSITPNTVICMGEALLITATGGTSCRWLDDAAITSYDRTVTPTTTTSYVAIVSDQGCSDTLRVTVSVDPLPTLTTRADTTICGGGTIELLAVTDAPQVRWEPADL